MNRWLPAALCWIIALLILIGIAKPSWRLRWIRTARDAGGPRISALTALLFGAYFALFGFNLIVQYPGSLPRISMLIILAVSIGSAIRDYALANRR
jgi:hypothetical protein